MTWHNETITTMGIISDEAYDENYFNGKYDELIANGTIYEVIDHTDTSSDMQALLLKSGDEYVVAFRGTKGVVDILVDGVIGLGNINAQYTEALAFVKKALDRTDLDVDITTKNLTLAGHSLGGILTQQVGVALELDGYAFNPFGFQGNFASQLLFASFDVAINNNLNLKNEREVA